MQDWRDAGKDGCRKGGMKKRRDKEKKGMHKKEGCRRGGIQEVRLG